MSGWSGGRALRRIASASSMALPGRRVVPQIILHEPQVVQAPGDVGVVRGRALRRMASASSWLCFAAA